jgi:Ca-activated chloride channel family protein
MSVLAFSFRQGWVGVLVLALGALVVLEVRRRARRSPPESLDGSAVVANVGPSAQAPSFARIVRRYFRLIGAEVALVVVVGIAGLLLAMRPISAQSLQRQSLSRDIMLCLDVSGSMKELDENILRHFVRIAEGLPGDRIGLTIWNGAAISVFPLTEDANYVDGMLEFAVDQLNRGARSFVMGTEEGGSSLIGDGLASCVFRFDRLDEERARSIVLATDNALAGEPLVTLSEAAQLAADRGVRVYAVAPAFYITDDDAADLEEAATSTGGSYLTTADDHVVEHVIEQIVVEEAAHLDRPPDVVRDDRPRVLASVAFVGVAIAGMISWVLRR